MGSNKNINPADAEWLCREPNGDCTSWYPTREDCVNAGGTVVTPADCSAGAQAYTRFDLEEAITACWNTSDDIDLIASRAPEDDKTLNAIIGLKELHDKRVQRVFDILEALVKSGALQ